METNFTQLTEQQLEQINLGDMRGDLVVLVAKDVPFYHALRVLKKFDEELGTLYIEEYKDKLYKVEMVDNVIQVTLHERETNIDPY